MPTLAELDIARLFEERQELANVDALLLDPYHPNEAHSDQGRQAKIRRLKARAAKNQSAAIYQLQLAAVDGALDKALQTFDAGVGRLTRIRKLGELAASARPRIDVMERLALGQLLGDLPEGLSVLDRVQMLIDELELERGVLRTTAENRDLAREQVRQLWEALDNVVRPTGRLPEELVRHLARRVLDKCPPVPVDAPTPTAPAQPLFAVGQRVRKVTGDYNIAGEVRSVFATAAGAIRYVVEHQAEGGGSFLHVYGEANLAAEPAQ